MTEVDQAGEEFAHIRRVLRERAEAEAARTLARGQRRAERWPAIKRRVAAFTSRMDDRLVPFLKARLRLLGPAIIRAARTVWVATNLFSRYIAQRSMALAKTAIHQYRARRSAPRPAPEPEVVPAAPPTPADPSVERERRTEELERQQLALREAALGPDHPDVALITYVIAARSAARGDFDEAQAQYERTLRIFEKTLGVDHPEVAAVLTDLAELHASAGRTVDATWYASRATKIMDRRRARFDAVAEAPTEVAEAAR